MIVSVWYSSLLDKQKKQLAQDILASNPEDKFIFIIVNGMHEDVPFPQWVEDEGLKDLIQFKTPKRLTNYSHGTSKEKFNLYVLSKTPIEKASYDDAKSNTTGQT